MKIFIALCLVALSSAKLIEHDPALDQDWADFKQLYGKTYEHDLAEATHRSTWEDNLAYITQHNAEAEQGMHTFTVGVNAYADLTVEEFKALLNGYAGAPAIQRGRRHVVKNDTLPDTVDWRTKGYVTPIKDQKQCGSCWAFSAVGSLEGQHFKKTGKLVSLSEQNLVDCDKTSFGCMGGLMTNAFDYIKNNNGIDTEASYPYTARDGKCLFKSADVGATCTGYVNIKKGSEADLQNAVATVGPISVAIDAGHQSFQLYKNGVYNEPDCSSTQLDHGVVAVGYGTDAGKDYWLVKNSWGKSWGEQGYIQMSRNADNNCGIATDASYPTV